MARVEPASSKGKPSPLLLAARLPELQVVVIHRHVPQVQRRRVRHIGRISGVIVTLAVYQNAVDLFFSAWVRPPEA